MTELVPKFSMIKKGDITLYEIYVEWHYGVGGNPSIAFLNENGSRWRTRTSADRMFYRKRKAVVDFTTWAIRRIKYLYGVQDNHGTLPKNRITPNQVNNTEASGKKKKGNKNKTTDDDMQDDFYLKVHITPEWEQIMLGNIPLPKKIDTVSFFRPRHPYQINVFNNEKMSLEHASQKDLDEAKARLGLLENNAENNLIQQILFYLDDTIQSINISWARIANFLLAMKMKYKKSGDNFELSMFDDCLIHENVSEMALKKASSFMSTDTIKEGEGLSPDSSTTLVPDMDFMGQFNNNYNVFNSKTNNGDGNITNMSTPEISPWNFSTITYPEDLPSRKRKLSDGTTITHPSYDDFPTLLSLENVEGLPNEVAGQPIKVQKLMPLPPSDLDTSREEITGRQPIDMFVSASIAKEIKELAEIKSTLTNIVHRVSEIERQSGFRIFAMNGLTGESLGGLHSPFPSGYSSISAETIPTGKFFKGKNKKKTAVGK